jgi:Fic family protein
MAMPKVELSRAGNIIRQSSGYDAFIPHKLCDQGLKLDIHYKNMIQLVSESDRALGELTGVTKTVPDPDLFIAFYVRKEALLSSQIEGTQCSLEEVLQVDETVPEIKPVHEVVNYIKAMNYGLGALEKLPLSLRLIHEIHKVLLEGVRGKEKTPGEYKRYQNYIGPPGCNLNEAVFVSPPPAMMVELMGDWENYYYKQSNYVDLINAAILHAQFETIHPYAGEAFDYFHAL